MNSSRRGSSSRRARRSPTREPGGASIDAVEVNRNATRYLPTCLAALARSTVPVRVIVVDNASTDGSVAYLREHHPQVELLALAENRGYAGGANAGLRAATGEYAIILNPDVALAPDHLELLRARLEAEPVRSTHPHSSRCRQRGRGE